ncbi:MAG: PQQ-binding-like beta-propeller repeat protein [Pirellulaceae bacterium]
MLSRAVGVVAFKLACLIFVQVGAAQPDADATERKLGPMVWRVWAINDVSQENEARESANALSSKGEFLLPQSVPLVTDDWIYMRTPRRLMAVEDATGKRRWEFPWYAAEAAPAAPEFRDRRKLEGSSSYLLQQRLWQDAVFADISVGGGLVTVIDKLSATPASLPRSLPVRSWVQPSPTNELVALDVDTQGKLQWSIGGESNRDEPKTAGMFFVGSGVLRDGKLFALALKERSLQVLRLSAKTGALEERLEIATLPEDEPTEFYTLRVGGVRPLLVENLLVCPTSINQVVAVDIEKQEVAWKFEYEPPAGIRAAFRRGDLDRRHWFDNQPFTADGLVIATPLDSDKLFALDAATGELRWRRAAGEARLAAVEGSTVLLISPRSISACRASDGELLWEGLNGEPLSEDLRVGLPRGTHFSGRGVFDRGRFLVPTTAQELLAIDLKSGKIAELFKTPSVLGNLVVHGGHLYSQDSLALVKFPWP